MDTPAQPDARRWTAGPWARYAWLPVPVLVAVMVGLWVVNPRTPWVSRYLLWLLAYGPTALAIVYIVIPAARNFLASGQPPRAHAGVRHVGDRPGGHRRRERGPPQPGHELGHL